jgi:teichoic acid transport system permease protein
MAAPAHAAPKAYSDDVFVFEPGRSWHPGLREYFADVWKRRHFIVELARSDIRGSKSNQLLGQLWAVLDPLMQATIYWILVTLIRGSRDGELSAAQTAALIIGCVFLFSQFRVAFGEGSRELVKRKGLILNSMFPMAMFPLTAMYRGILELIPMIGVYAVFHVAAGMPFGPGLFMLPFLFALQLLMSFGICLLTTTAIVFVKDMANVTNYILRILFFMTPIIYPVSALSDVPSVLQAIIWLNPLFPLFAAYQEILLGGVPTFTQVFVTGAWAAFYLVVGYRVFVTHERAFAIRL